MLLGMPVAHSQVSGFGVLPLFVTQLPAHMYPGRQQILCESVASSARYPVSSSASDLRDWEKADDALSLSPCHPNGTPGWSSWL